MESAEPEELECVRCGEVKRHSGDWYGDFCPECADETDGDWLCAICGDSGNFEEMKGEADVEPHCCGQPCVRIDPDDQSAADVAAPRSGLVPAVVGQPTEDSVKELKLFVSTYYGEANTHVEGVDEREEFGEPEVPVLIHEADGLRIVLGSHDFHDGNAPDIQIERRPNGWAIFLHPTASDPSGYVYFLDSGESFLVPEAFSGAIEVIDSIKEIPKLDWPVADPHLTRESDPVVEGNGESGADNSPSKR